MLPVRCRIRYKIMLLLHNISWTSYQAISQPELYVQQMLVCWLFHTVGQPRMETISFSCSTPTMERSTTSPPHSWARTPFLKTIKDFFFLMKLTTILFEHWLLVSLTFFNFMFLCNAPLNGIFILDLWRRLNAE